MLPRPPMQQAYVTGVHQWAVFKSPLAPCMCPCLQARPWLGLGWVQLWLGLGWVRLWWGPVWVRLWWARAWAPLWLARVWEQAWVWALGNLQSRQQCWT